METAGERDGGWYGRWPRWRLHQSLSEKWKEERFSTIDRVSSSSSSSTTRYIRIVYISIWENGDSERQWERQTNKIELIYKIQESGVEREHLAIWFEMHERKKNKRIVTFTVAGVATIEWIFLRQSDMQQHTPIKASHLFRGTLSRNRPL
ncbi:uncharacterized protein LOC113219137 isoform X2 [Apis mellifera]|uniref:Uncharacterized protein LOC113219137 isoform X2 n=1 Tax=Apis mellifera TaxID=7460 RepID=A0A7M7MRJ7_APIME|nr:uncharacterized protein LOC113219137 isoform X2 [Apis mellifera]|eukprot:XP_026299843.1 uncharacterized protein LOC113219137 isoform X2 [Apis mellifera]